MPSKRPALLLPGLIVFVCLFSFIAYLLIRNQPEASDQQALSNTLTDVDAEPENVGTEFRNMQQPSQQKPDMDDNTSRRAESAIDTDLVNAVSVDSKAQTERPDKEFNYQLDSFTSTDFRVEGRAQSDIGEMAFNSELLPSNEVKLTLNLNQADMDAVQLTAYFDLAYFRMELDGGNRILNKEHKKLLKLTSLKLRPEFERQYRDYDMPEHALMLVQMMDYWSVSPEGFVHEKREIVSQ